MDRLLIFEHTGRQAAGMPDELIGAAWVKLMRQAFPKRSWNLPPNHSGRQLPKLKLKPDQVEKIIKRHVKPRAEFEWRTSFHDWSKAPLLPMIKEYLKRRRAADELIKLKRKKRDQQKPGSQRRIVESIMRAVKPRFCKFCAKELPAWSKPERKTCSPACRKALERDRRRKAKAAAARRGSRKGAQAFRGRRGASRGPLLKRRSLRRITRKSRRT